MLELPQGQSEIGNCFEAARDALTILIKESHKGRMTTPILQTTLRCPLCGHEESVTMPTDACVFFHECTSCKTLLRPKTGDCCVFCSYGSVRCPPQQMKNS